MKYIKTNWSIPFYNMAFEEYAIKHLDPDENYMFFYIHDPSIIIGKHQNTIEEINKEYVDTKNIHVARRLSGGGAVYHDHGNLNYSFILKADKEDVNNFKKFTKPVIRALDKLGIKAELTGRNDITIDGKKFSGNAQYYHKNRLLHHGTLLFNSDMGCLTKALKVKDLKIKSKGIKSVRSRVTNISEYLDKDKSIIEFKEYLLDFMSQEQQIEEYILTEKDIKSINKLVEEKFSTWEWNWGESPEFDLQKMDKFECGIIDIRLNVKNGTITNIKIFGDFFSKDDISNLENKLIDIEYREEAIRTALIDVDIQDYFMYFSKSDFIEFLLSQ